MKRTEDRGQKTEDRKDRASYEGLQENIRNLETPRIEVWQNQYANKVYTINLDIPEFTCICPKTGLPDFATIRIEYCPAKFCVELKSFKLYTISFRNVGIFHEHLINKMLEDFVAAVKPRWLKITGVFNPRGGITTTVWREYKTK
ncbi:MAG: preQ(1) synthase [Candidatus Omnitrophica bacterium]|nr:preQ(1) synthase [Candidatus Omnitrophota bacterium]MBU4303842.1 preQ(1) synthase [Candidatus Omnitrophota bacterium]MBU4419111.1 preQ(1) synthase [Candidatus Omnitrophota bacterium]MBU4468033.1 preQ(1) synthase [Candidatus Omnitrophota bacterium]MCG2707830.1 preQ(1) synthase [Candidatus Omnitrophota bacterium]